MKLDAEIKKILRRKTNGVYPLQIHNYTSIKYKMYVYNISIDNKEYWTASLQDMPPGSGWMWHYYSDSEDDCAKETYKKIFKYIKQVTKNDNLSGGHFIRHKLWGKWLDNYFVLKRSN